MEEVRTTVVKMSMAVYEADALRGAAIVGALMAERMVTRGTPFAAAFDPMMLIPAAIGAVGDGVIAKIPILSSIADGLNKLAGSIVPDVSLGGAAAAYSAAVVSAAGRGGGLRNFRVEYLLPIDQQSLMCAGAAGLGFMAGSYLSDMFITKPLMTKVAPAMGAAL